MGVLYECPYAICIHHPSGGRYVSKKTFCRHRGSNTALCRAKRRQTDDAAADEESSALGPGHDGCVEKEEAGDGAYATCVDEQDEEADGGVLERTGGGSVGAWVVDGCGSDSRGNGDGSVKSYGRDAGAPPEEEDLPVDMLQDFPLSDVGDDKKEIMLRTLEFFFSRRFSHWMTHSAGLLTRSTSGRSRRLLLPLSRRPCRQRQSPK